MTRDRFWAIIAASREGFDPQDIEAGQERQLTRLRDLLVHFEDFPYVVHRVWREKTGQPD